jgi:Fur family transcriptional regulator, peroxide stress response regulator
MGEHSFVEGKISSIESLCRERGLALTVQRRMILENLASRADHPTADQIYDAVKERIRGLSRTTVYRVLETFVLLGVVTKVSNPQSKARFEADMEHHHHLICIGCKTVMDCRDMRLDGIEVPTEVGDGFVVSNFSLAITGLCGSCRREETP